MLSHHLPQFFAHLASVGRHVFAYGHACSRTVAGTLFHLQSPRDAFRVALRQGRYALDKPVPGASRAPLLIHYHIFKNAGTSFEWALQQAWGGRFRQYDSTSPAGVVTASDIARLARSEPALCAISSHQAKPPPPRILGRRVITSILIRDPIARIGSIYGFERTQKVNTPGALKAKELDFKAYVEWRLETSPTLFCNYQVSLCSGRRDAGSCRQRDLEAAIIRLDSIDIVGTVARYDEWLALAQAILRQHFGEIDLPNVHHNRSSAGPVQSEAKVFARLTRDLGPAMTKELLRRNELDMALHQVADALLTRRLAEGAIAIKLRDAYAQARHQAADGGTSL